MDGQMDKWTDTQIPPVFYRTSSSSCPLPKKGEIEREQKRARERERERGREREKKRDRDSITEEGIRRCSQSPCTDMLRILMSVGFK